MEIVNKVASSGIITLNLEEYYTEGERIVIDIKDQLFMGLILKEKDFREFIKTHDWEQYQNKLVAITCSTDAIVPTWAYMLVATKLTGIAKDFIFGNVETLETNLIVNKLQSQINPEDFNTARVVIKGCGHIKITDAAYVAITKLLVPHVQSLMFGEPCSTVPVFKKAK